ncbi:uncharacterized protein BHQ10_009476 [Talaromyces amestolkiae]|uniref:Alginate lyase domain-containing protein n=1 Tax=Talaromyces amestolkiae TaxID=1196081 RepID=A0A364LCC2_TALAM|nr:uncharacterized protein BHQ10_009476 [Talaromyces amestolkiae]RAO73464.1 hypothetical protein BHQ10_009476 [Talaromyces amestolkiae]
MFCFNHFFKLFVLLVPLVSGFTHPGLLVTSNDINRIKQKLDAHKDPWLASWRQLISMKSASASYTNNAVSSVDRDTQGSTPPNADRLWHDAGAAFALALRWKISGDTSYADTAVNILTAWSDKLYSIGANDDQYLVAGLQGHELANVGELLRDYPPFVSGGGQAKFLNMMTSLFLEKNLFFLNHRDGSEHIVKHFFANWELANLASAMAISVLTDNQTAWEYSIDYFKNGAGNGAINNAVTNIVLEPETGNPLGQGQEEGRDQGHSALDFQLLGVIGQQAWNQGEDLFAYNNSRILLGAEYFARYNLGNDVPFEPYTNGIVSFHQISNASRGACRPAWELLYNHYVVIKNQKAPWTTKFWNKSLEQFGGHEPGAGAWGEGSGHYDSLGWGSLLYRLEESDVAQAANIAISTSSLIPSSILRSVYSAVGSSLVLPTITPTHTPSGRRHHHHSHYSSSASTSTTVPPQDACYAA